MYIKHVFIKEGLECIFVYVRSNFTEHIFSALRCHMSEVKGQQR